MTRQIQIFNPVHLQKIKSENLTVMGRLISGNKRQPLTAYLNGFLVRKVTPSANGAFECRVDLSSLPLDEQQVIEIRLFSARGTERIKIPFFKVAPKPES